MARPLLIAALIGLIGLCSLLALYGVIGGRPTAPGAAIVPPARLTTPMTPRGEGGPVHVLLVGTSLTARGNWPEKLEQALASCAKTDVVVERLAKSGKGIRWGLPALQERLSNADMPRPDITVVEFTGNDASLRQGLPLFLARKRTLHLIEMLRDTGSTVFLSTMNPGWGGEAITRPGQARYHGMYRDIAAETGVGLIDTAPIWRALDLQMRNRLVPDNGHPNDEGAALITIPAFFAALSPILCEGM